MKSKFLPHTKKNLEENYRIGMEEIVVTIYDQYSTVTLPKAPYDMIFIIKNKTNLPLKITSK